MTSPAHNRHPASRRTAWQRAVIEATKGRPITDLEAEQMSESISSLNERLRAAATAMPEQPEEGA